MFDLDKIFGVTPRGTVLSTYNGDVAIPRPFCFVLNVAGTGKDGAIEVAPGQMLRCATNEEIKFIKEMIESLFGRHFGASLWESQRPKSGRGKYRTRPANQWRYFVIELDLAFEDFDLLEQASTIARCGLEIGFAVSRTTFEKLELAASIYRPPQLFQSLTALSEVHHSEIGGGKTIAKSDGKDVAEIYARLKLHDHSLLDLRRILIQLLELKDLPHFSPLQILGYFAILESILTHQPNPEDRYDSITRQITQKLALLDRRWQPPLNYADFGAAKHETIWSKMYAYRSAIAHGTAPDFSSKLSILKSAECANLLIKETVKQVIRHSLVEPTLIADLHNC